MDELASIRTFLEVVDCGSFSAAARRNDMTVSSVARQVKALEDDLGVRLLNRTTRSNSLTDAGSQFYERARDIVSELSAAKSDAASFQTTAKGRLRVALRTSTSRVIVPALPEFLERHPGLHIDMMLTDERIDLVANKIDVAVWLGHLEDSRIVARRLTPSKRVVCASPAYLARFGRPLLPGDVSNHNCVVYKGSIYQHFWRFTREDEQIDVKVDGNLVTNSSPALVPAALAGIGLIAVQRYSVTSLLKDGSLEQVLSEYEVSPTEIDTAVYAVYPHTLGVSRKTRVFVDFLVDLFRY